jgi:Undecaprenyl-phosphate galactose phosphotransferase WbaP
MSAKPHAISSPALASGSALATSNSSLAITMCVAAADFLTLSAVFGLAVLWRHYLSPLYPLSSYFQLAPLMVMVMSAFFLQGLYPGVLLHPAEEMRRIFVSITVVFLLMSCTTFLWRTGAEYSRSVFLVTWTGGAPMVLLVRYFMRRRFKGFEWWGVTAVVLGSGMAAQRVARTLRDGRWGVKVIGMLSDDAPAAWPSDLPPVLGPISSAPGFCKERWAHYAIIAMPNRTAQEIRHLIQDWCYGFQHVLLMPDMPGICSLGIAPREVGGEVGFEMPQRLFQRVPSVAKRSLDFAFSLAGIVLLAPLFVVLAAAVKLSSKGPVCYGQVRYGKNGAMFKAWKFRSMVPHAESILAAHLAAHPEDLFEWQRDHKLKNDPRVTPIGRCLRRLSLDELPQLFNVLAGQMSLVGPRPIVKDEIEKYGRRFGLYSRVRPGITGLWQVSGRNNTTYEERIALDEYYVHNWSVWFDTYILLRTVKTVFRREGAY